MIDSLLRADNARGVDAAESLRGVDASDSLSCVNNATFRGVDAAESALGEDARESTSPDMSRKVSEGESSEVGVKGDPTDEGVREWGEWASPYEVVVVVVPVLCGTLMSEGERGEECACSARGDW